MNYTAKSIRTFIGAKNFHESRTFYQEFDFEEIIIDPKMSYFKVNEDMGFYLQDYYVKDWVDNSMIFLEVDNLNVCLKTLLEKDLTKKYQQVRISKIKNEDWGREVFMHDPAGVLWHFGEFKKESHENE